MAVMERDAWTDERLDDLAAGIDKRFDRVDADIRELRSDMKKGFEGVDKKFEGIDQKFERMDARFDSLQNNMLIGLIGLFGSIVGSAIAAVLAAIALT
jgi:hypothetical protein